MNNFECIVALILIICLVGNATGWWPHILGHGDNDNRDSCMEYLKQFVVGIQMRGQANVQLVESGSNVVSVVVSCIVQRQSQVKWAFAVWAKIARLQQEGGKREVGSFVKLSEPLTSFHSSLSQPCLTVFQIKPFRSSAALLDLSRPMFTQIT